LSFLDTSFLALESPTTHMHVAAVAMYDSGPLQTGDGGIDIDKIRRFIGAKLHLVPRYRQHLAWIPIDRHPVWVDDAEFDIEYHVRHTALPQPGTEEQLRLQVGEILSRQLDRTKPLWELWVVEGIDGNRFAIVSKIHHAMIDGVSGIDLMAMLFGFAPTDEIPEAPGFEPEPVPSGTELLVGEAARRAGRIVYRLRSVRHLADMAPEIAVNAGARALAASRALTSGWLRSTTLTPLNGDIGPNRRFGWFSIDLDEVKEIKNVCGVTVNDVVLATVAGAVRSYLIEERDFDPSDADFRVMAPVSVRSSSERGTLGNQVAMWLVPLPLGEESPRDRLATIRNETIELKATNQALGAATLVRLSSGAPITLLSLATRLAAGVRPFNMTVTNVPGPQFPLYLLGSRLLAQYPLVPLWHHHGLGIAIFSYDGRMDWGLNADWDRVPDLEVFVAHLERAFVELRAGARRKKAEGA
jgi:WS/DGAT/MGAT family acyltransferase